MEKKKYETPTVEKIAFTYRDQVVAASGTMNCVPVWANLGVDECRTAPELFHKGNM